MATQCAQCGQTAGVRRGRCVGCGAAADVVEIVRHRRRAAVLHVIGAEWYWWLGEIVGLVFIALVAVNALPVWTLMIAAVFLLRPLSRLVMLLARGGIDQLPG